MSSCGSVKESIGVPKGRLNSKERDRRASGILKQITGSQKSKGRKVVKP